MSYEKQTWANGDVITAEKLNHIEDGVYANSQSGGALIVNDLIDEQTGIETLDKTYTEITAAIDAGIYVTVLSRDAHDTTTVMFVAQCSIIGFEEPKQYEVRVFDGEVIDAGMSPIIVFRSTTADGVLSYYEEPNQ